MALSRDLHDFMRDHAKLTDGSEALNVDISTAHQYNLPRPQCLGYVLQ